MAIFYDPDANCYITGEVYIGPLSSYTGRSSLAAVMDEAPHDTPIGHAPKGRGPQRNRPVVAIAVSSYMKMRSDDGRGWRKMDRAHPNAKPCATCVEGFLRPCDVRRRYSRCETCRREAMTPA
jgi:hypothetical protein